MTETEQSATTNEEKTPEVSQEPKPFTGVWADMTHGNYTQMLTDLKTEAEAAIASGDQTLAKWARSTGTFASLLLTFLNGTHPEEFDRMSSGSPSVPEQTPDNGSVG